jgi:hypothetical protein
MRICDGSIKVLFLGELIKWECQKGLSVNGGAINYLKGEGSSIFSQADQDSINLQKDKKCPRKRLLWGYEIHHPAPPYFLRKKQRRRKMSWWRRNADDVPS